MQDVVLSTLLARQEARAQEVRSILYAEGWYADSPGYDEVRALVEGNT
jgi:hypothetical protein